MSITLTDVTYGQIALYSLYFALICLLAVFVWLIFSVVSKSIERFFFSFFNVRLKRKGTPNSKIITIKRYKIITRAILNWIEKILIISLILFVILTAIKLSIPSETFAYTIITLFIFIISSQIASFIRSSWATDRYILSPIIKIGELIEIDNEIGIIEDIGKDFFWLRCKNSEICKYVRFPINVLNFQKFAKIESYNFNNNPKKKKIKPINSKYGLINRKENQNLFEFNTRNDTEIKIF